MPNRELLPRKARQRAFSVIPVLLLVTLSSACAFSLFAHSLTQRRTNDELSGYYQARSAAVAGMRIALGQLQTYTGPDACATACLGISDSEKNNPSWVGVWHSARGRAESGNVAVPMVSNRGIFANSDEICTFRMRSNGSVVHVPWEKLCENARIAYFIKDESQRASVSKRERDNYLESAENDAETLQHLRQQIPRRTNFESFFDTIAPDSPTFRKKLSAAPDENIFLAEYFENLPPQERKRAQAAFTHSTLGIPADWERNCLKIKLSDSSAYAQLQDIAPTSALKIFDDSNTFPKTGIPIATNPPTPSGNTGHFFHPFPLLCELKLHFGLFNPRSDGQHRARFHVTAKFWNPYAFPLLAHSDGRIGLFDVENLPTIEIRNHNTGGFVTFSPSNFPIGRFGLVRQTPSDKTCNAYCRIFDVSPQGMGDDGNATGLLGGEVFLARFPDPAGQPMGLARNTGGSSWKYQKDLLKVTKPPSGAKDDAWFHPKHIISVGSIPGILPANFLIRGDAGSMHQQADPDLYSEPVFAFRNIPLPPFYTEMPGAEYNREKAGDYDVSQATFVWKIRLRTEDSDAMETLLKNVDPRLGIFDFRDPHVRNAFEIQALTGKHAQAEAALGGNDESPVQHPSLLRDPYPNAHETDKADAFTCIRLFDTPTSPVATLGALRHEAFEKIPPLASFGTPASGSHKFSINTIFDRAQISDQRKNPHSITIKEHSLISGAFNINSEIPDAWIAVLPHNISDWKFQQAQGSLLSQDTSDLKHAFFSQPFTAAIPRSVVGAQFYSDKDATLLPDDARERKMSGQGVREVEPSTLRRLSESIVAQIRDRRERNEKPFRSLSEFADSGLLDTAIRTSKINTLREKAIPSWTPAAISQASLMDSLSTCAVPRGDTFTIICCAEVFHPLTQKSLGRAYVKTRVQRLPEFFDDSQAPDTLHAQQNTLNRVFGRRYKIISSRIVPHDEL